MSPTTSSADPRALWRYQRAAEARSQQLLAEADRLAAALEAFQATCTEDALGIDAGLAAPLRAHARRDQALGAWVGRIGAAFARADQGEGGNWLDAGAAVAPAEQICPAAGVPPTLASVPATAGLSPADVLDGIQMGLDIVGLIPGFGEIADGINAVISLSRGDYVGASLCIAAMVPFVGWGAAATKIGRRIIDLGGSWIPVAARHSDEVANLVEATGKVSDDAREVITLTRSGTRVDAFLVVRNIVGDLGTDTASVHGRFGSQKARVVGRMSNDGRRGWRLDYDPVKGPHYNYFDHDRGIYGVVPFEGDEEHVYRLIDMLNRTYD